MKSCQRYDKSSLKGEWFGSCDSFVHAQLWSYNFAMEHMPLTEINNAVDDGPLLLTPMATVLHDTDVIH